MLPGKGHFYVGIIGLSKHSHLLLQRQATTDILCRYEIKLSLLNQALQTDFDQKIPGHFQDKMGHFQDKMAKFQDIKNPKKSKVESVTTTVTLMPLNNDVIIVMI